MKKTPLTLPCVSLGAEYLVMGYLLRRNIMTFKAPEGNQGYDLLCINPDPLIKSKAVRVQVKSRYQSDSDGGFTMSKESIGAFDYLVVASMNIGSFFRNKNLPSINGRKDPEFYTFPAKWVIQHHKISPSGRGSIYIRKLDIEKFKGDAGFEQIAKKLKILYPSKEQIG